MPTDEVRAPPPRSVRASAKSDAVQGSFALDAGSLPDFGGLMAGLNAAVAGNAGTDPDQAARNWVRDNGFNHPIAQ